MRFRVGCMLLSIWAILLPGCASNKKKPLKLEHDIIIQKVKDNVYVATDTAFYDSNILIVKMSDGTVVVASSPFDSLGARSLIDWIKLSLVPKKIIAINTHFHRDGTGGNDSYLKEGVEVWSSDLTRDLLQKEINKNSNDLNFYKSEKLKSRIRASRLVKAENIFELAKGKTFDFSGEKVQIFFPGHAHSPDNVVVYFPKERVLFGGCMIKPSSLGYLGVADIKNWAKATKNLTSFSFDTVVPGHEPWGGPDLVTKTIAVAEKVNKDIKLQTKGSQ